MIVEDTGIPLEDNFTVPPLPEGETYAEKLQKAVGARNWTIPLRFGSLVSGIGRS